MDAKERPRLAGVADPVEPEDGPKGHPALQQVDPRGRVREVVRDLTDHLLAHDFNLVDHDGLPTRWGIYSPARLNFDPDWWAERGLKSLSILSYLAGAQYVTGDAKYGRASRELIEKHDYAQNLMFPKVQQGPGSGNQSDDEMAFMCFYNLLRYSQDEELKGRVRWSFFRYWANEAAEIVPHRNGVEREVERVLEPREVFAVAIRHDVRGTEALRVFDFFGRGRENRAGADERRYRRPPGRTRPRARAAPR